MRLAHVLALLALTLAPLTATAQPSALKTEAEARYQEGIALHDRGKDEEAFLKFTQAYAIVKTPPILFNLARTEHLTGRLVEARGHFREYLRLPPHPRITAESHERAQRFFDELGGRLGRIKIDAPAGASLAVDGAALAQPAPLDEVVDVRPGAHTVIASLGAKSATVRLNVDAGAEQTARMAFEEAAPPSVPTAVPPVTTTTTIPPPMPRHETPVPAPDHAARDALRWTTLAVGVGGIALGVGFMVDARSSADSLASLQTGSAHGCGNGSATACGQALSLKDAHDQSATISEVTFVVGGVALAMSAALWLLWPKDVKTIGGTWVAPRVGSGGYGLDIGGRF